MTSLSYISSAGDTDADLIRDVAPIRLIQPEWVGNDYRNWQAAETEVRLLLIFALWFAALALISRRHFQSSRVAPWLASFTVAAAVVYPIVRACVRPLVDFPK